MAGYNPFSFSQYQAWQAGNQAPQTQGVIGPAATQPYDASNYPSGGTSSGIPGFNPMTPGGGFGFGPSPSTGGTSGLGAMNRYAQWIGQQPTDGPVFPGMAADQSLAQQACGGMPAWPSTWPSTWPSNPSLGLGFPTPYRMG